MKNRVKMMAVTMKHERRDIGQFVTPILLLCLSVVLGLNTIQTWQPREAAWVNRYLADLSATERLRIAELHKDTGIPNPGPEAKLPPIFVPMESGRVTATTGAELLLMKGGDVEIGPYNSRMAAVEPLLSKFGRKGIPFDEFSVLDKPSWDGLDSGVKTILVETFLESSSVGSLTIDHPDTYEAVAEAMKEAVLSRPTRAELITDYFGRSYWKSGAWIVPAWETVETNRNLQVIRNIYISASGQRPRISDELASKLSSGGSLESRLIQQLQIDCQQDSQAACVDLLDSGFVSSE